MTAKEVPLETALKGLPSRKITQLINKGFQTVDDLVRFLPRRYEDRSNVISDYRLLPNYIGQKITVVGNVEEVSVNYGKDILTVILKDTGTYSMANYISASNTVLIFRRPAILTPKSLHSKHRYLSMAKFRG